MLSLLCVYFLDLAILEKELHLKRDTSPETASSRLEEDAEDPKRVCDVGMR